MNLLVDIGGTKTRVGVSKEPAILGEYSIIPTNPNFETGVENIIQLGKKLSGGEKIEHICVGVGHPLDSEKSFIVNSFKENFHHWVGKNLKIPLEKAFNSNVYLENDTALACLGEAKYGAGKGFSIVTYLTISTGIGGCRVENGKITTSHQGFEPGHQIIQKIDGKFLRAEEILGGESIQKKFGKIPSEIKDENFWNLMAENLAIIVNNTIVFWSPEIIIIGGALINDIPFEIFNEKLQKMLKIFPKLPLIEKSSLKDVCGLYGAMAFLESLK